MRKISDITRKKILEMWLAGDSYREIQRACQVALATINAVKEEAKNDQPDLEELRKLNILLKKSDVNFYDTLRGARLLERLNNLGASLDDLGDFIELIETHFLEESGRRDEIIEAAIKLMNLEKETGTHYPQIISEFQKLSSKIPKLKNTVKRLRQEIQQKETDNSKFDKRGRELQAENRILCNKKNDLLSYTSSIAGVAHAIKERVLSIPCKHCGRPMPAKLPGKREYETLVQQHLNYRIRCQDCGYMNAVHPEEFTLQIGWTLLPPGEKVDIINL